MFIQMRKIIRFYSSWLNFGILGKEQSNTFVKKLSEIFFRRKELKTFVTKADFSVFTATNNRVNLITADDERSQSGRGPHLAPGLWLLVPQRMSTSGNGLHLLARGQVNFKLKIKSNLEVQ